MEEYAGVRFQTRYLERRPPAVAIARDLVTWCRTFHENGFAGTGDEPAGNLSCRLERGFLVTPAGTSLAHVGVDDLVHVVEVHLEAGTLLVCGRGAPSSEALLHHLVYARRRDAGAVLHGHSAEILAHGRLLGIPTTAREEPYGTRALADLAAEAARTQDFFLLANHGFVAVGRTLDEAGRRALETRALVRNR